MPGCHGLFLGMADRTISLTTFLLLYYTELLTVIQSYRLHPHLNLKNSYLSENGKISLWEIKYIKIIILVPTGILSEKNKMKVIVW